MFRIVGRLVSFIKPIKSPQILVKSHAFTSAGNRTLSFSNINAFRFSTYPKHEVLTVKCEIKVDASTFANHDRRENSEMGKERGR